MDDLKKVVSTTSTSSFLGRIFQPTKNRCRLLRTSEEVKGGVEFSVKNVFFKHRTGKSKSITKWEEMREEDRNREEKVRIC